MTPAARIAAAIEILDAFAASETEMVDKILARWAREHRFAGSKDRAAIADRVYDVLRRYGSSAARFGETARGRAIGSLVAEGLSLGEIETLFDGGRHSPEPLDAAERDAVVRSIGQPAPIRRDWPNWLYPELERSVADPEAEIAGLSARAPVDLRVNLLKTDVAAALRRLDQETASLGLDVVAEPSPISPVGLRLNRPAPVHRTALFEDGWVEPQDAASQAVALLAVAGLPQRATILDYCAGGGGKTLAMAAAAPDATLYAFDVAPQRMADLPARAARAGAAPVLTSRRDLKPLIGRCDLVLVDAPCSGSGAWARNPDAKWRLTPGRFAALQTAQRGALAEAARFVRPGGRLAYATCSLLQSENSEAVGAFLARVPDFAPTSLAPLWRQAGLRGAPSSTNETVFTPATTRTDGFYATVFTRAGDDC